MVDWKSQEEVEKDFSIFIKLMHALLGLYVWEFFVSLDFDWAVLTGKKKFHWPMIFYFAGRYLLLSAMVGIAVGLDTPREINCRALYAFNQLAGDAAVGLASINLSLRTVAIWAHNKWIIILLILIIIGHWSLILQGLLLTAVWVPGVGCQIMHSNTTILAATFIYSMCFDFVVMCLSAYKLAWIPMRRGTNGARTKLVGMLFSDGLIYFFITFVVNLIATTFMILHLNTITSIIFNVPAAVASTIVASRVVRRLNNFQLSGPELFLSERNSSIAFKANSAVLSRSGVVPIAPDIQVEMNTFTHVENIDLERYSGAHCSKSSADSYDGDCKPVQVI